MSLNALCKFVFYSDISMLPDRIIIHSCVNLKPTYLPGRTKQNLCLLLKRKHTFFKISLLDVESGTNCCQHTRTNKELTITNIRLTDTQCIFLKVSVFGVWRRSLLWPYRYHHPCLCNWRHFPSFPPNFQRFYFFFQKLLSCEAHRCFTDLNPQCFRAQ